MIQARFKHLEAAVIANRAHECHDPSDRRPRVCSPLGNCSFDAARLRPGLTRRDGTESLLSRFLFILENPFAVAVRRDRRPRRAPHSFCHRNLLLIRQSAAKATARPLALALLVAQQPPFLPPSFVQPFYSLALLVPSFPLPSSPTPPLDPLFRRRRHRPPSPLVNFEESYGGDGRGRGRPRQIPSYFPFSISRCGRQESPFATNLPPSDPGTLLRH